MFTANPGIIPKKKRVKFMKRVILALLALALFAGGALIAEGAPSDEFSVLAFSPSGTVKGRPPVKIVFSQPVAPKGVLHKSLPRDQFPLDFSPVLKGEGKWTDGKTFIFTPSENLPGATVFRVTVNEGVRDGKGRRVAGKQSWEFSTEPLRFLGARQVDFTSGNNVTLELAFNYPVLPFRLRGFLSLANDKNQPVEYFLAGGAPSSRLLINSSPYQEQSLNVILAAGFTSDTGPLGTEKDVRVKIPVTKKMEVRDAYPSSNYPDESGIYLSTSLGADMAVAAKFIELSPRAPFTIEPGYGGFYVRGNFKPRERYEVTVKKGLPARDGAKLERDFKKAVIFPDIYPSMQFPSAGNFLSPAGDLRIPIETVNIEEVELNLWRVYENNIPLAMTLQSYTIPRDLTRRIVTKKARPDGALNSPVRRAIDLRELAGDSKGVFLLTASDSSGGYWGEEEQLVAVTDLGVTARVAPAGITVWVNTILGMTSVDGASVKVYSRSNQALASGVTDSSGIWTWTGKEPWDSQLQPAVVTVEKGDDLSYLKLDRNILADSGFDTEGRPWSQGYDAMVFTPRGVFRPGERVDFTAIVRDSKQLAPEAFPVAYVIRSSTSREVARGTAMLSSEGMTSFHGELAPASPTGKYTASVFLPGDEDKPLGRAEFFVEDFVAPRLEVKASSETLALEPGGTASIDILSSYLFGAPAAGLPFEAELRAAAAPFKPKGWEAFVFGDGEKKFAPYSDFIGEGALDEKGEASVDFDAPEGWAPPASVNLTFLLRVMEESGRWVSSALQMPFHPYPFYLGIERPSGDAVPGKETSVRVAAATPDGKPAKMDSVKGSLFLVKRHYNLVRVDGQTRTQAQTELVPHGEAMVPLKEGVGTFKFTPKSWGEYVIIFADEGTGSSASTHMYAWAPWGMADESGSSLMDRVVLKGDKEKYAPGDRASISIKSPFAGNLLVTVDTDKELYREALTLDKGEVTIDIPISDEMIPNAYVTAWVIRPVKEGETWGSHRALGTLSLPVERGEKKLSVSLEAPDRILPGETLKVKGTLEDGSGASRKGEVSLFFVDEGILSLTAYATPDPWEFFMAKRALGLSVYDMYDLLLPLESRETPLLKAGGGAGEMAAMRAALSPVSARAFQLLSVFVGQIATDDEGAFEADLDLPEFSGKGRLMAVAASGDAFGKGEANVVMAREVTTELSLPRALSPGDSFSASLKVFSGSPEKQTARVTITSQGPISVKGKSVFSAELDKDGDDKLFDVEFTAGHDAGTGYLKVVTEWEGGSFTQDLDLPVRPPFPRIALSGSGVVMGGKKETITLPRDWFRGTEEGRLVLSDLPTLDLLGASLFLTSYPYGCLEQTVSSAWPLLVLPDLAEDADPDLADREQVRLALDRKIRQISAMQLYNGAFASWPGLSSPYPWGSVYGAHFLVEARKSGADVPEDLVNGALSYLRSLLPLMPGDESEAALTENMTLKAYASYVLALADEAPLGWMAYISENSALLRGSGAVFLAGAYGVSSNTSEPLKELGAVATAIRKGDETTMESSSRTEALKLLMWAEVDPLSGPAALLAEKLTAEARKKAWRTTQDNAMAILAMGRWMERTKEARKSFTARLVDSSGAEVASFKEGEKVVLDLGELPASDLTLEVRGNGMAYYGWTAAGVPEKAPAKKEAGVSVKRTWADRGGNPIAPGAAVKRGDRIEVTLTMSPREPIRNLVVTDMLPGGMEIENMRLSGGADLPESPYRTYGVRAEMRDDRLILFVDYLDKPVEYKYLIRAVTKGTFIVPPLAAEGMYSPETGAVTAVGKTEIR